MTHYVCTGGCKGESSNPGVCETEGCQKEGEPLLSCDCEDGSHEGAQEKEQDEDESVT